MSSFDWTDNIIMFMVAYAVLAALSDKIVFVWRLAAGAILFIFIIECVANIITYIRERGRRKWIL